MSTQTKNVQRRNSAAELRQYGRVLARHWVVVVSVALAGLFIAALVSIYSSPKYRAATTLYVSVRGNQASSDLLHGSDFVQASITSYADIATTDIVLERVRTELDTHLTGEELEHMLEISPVADSVLLQVAATHPVPEVAVDVADTTGTVLIDVVQHELQAATAGQDSPVQVRVVDSATIPERPVSPDIVRNSLLGLLGGILVGSSAIGLRQLMDTHKIQAAGDVEDQTGYPVLGRIPFDRQLAAHSLVVHNEQHNPRAEAFRTLRTNLQFVGWSDTSNVHLVSSATMGEGKTQISANLAVVLAASGARVVLVEADLRNPQLSPLMGIEGAVGLSDVLINRATLDEVLQPWGMDDLKILPAGRMPPNPSELLGSAQMRRLLEELQNMADYVLLDAAPLLAVTDAAVLSRLAADTVLVAALEQTTWHQLKLAISALETIDSRICGVVINKERTNNKASSYGNYRAYGLAATAGSSRSAA